MARVIEKTIYQFDELEAEGQERARDWYRGCIESDEVSDIEDWQAIAEILGIEFKTQSVRLYGGGSRHDPQIYWELNPDSAAYAGRYAYRKGAPKRIREYAPQDTVLHGIADRLQAIQRRYFYRLAADCETGGRNGTSQKVQSFRINNWDYNESIECDDLAECLTDFAHWIACTVSAQWDYLHSSECVDESIRANEYEFDEHGNIH